MIPISLTGAEFWEVNAMKPRVTRSGDSQAALHDLKKDMIFRAEPTWGEETHYAIIYLKILSGRKI